MLASRLYFPEFQMIQVDDILVLISF